MADESGLDICVHCGALLRGDKDVCPNCNKKIDEPDMSVEEPRPDTSESGDVGSEEGDLIFCSVCGAFVPEGADECPQCETPVKEEPDADAHAEKVEMDDDFESFLEFVQSDEEVGDKAEVPEEDEETEKEEEPDTFSLGDIYLEEELTEEDSDDGLVEDELVDDSLSDIDVEDISLTPDSEVLDELVDDSEKPDVREEVEKTLVVESVGESLSDVVHFDEIHEEDVVRLCANCGALISRNAKECTVCGEELTADNILIPSNVKRNILERMPDHQVEDTMRQFLGIEEGLKIEEVPEDKSPPPDLNMCSACGALLAKDASQCFICNTKVEDMPELILPEITADTGLSIAACPECGAFISETATHCNVCGKEIVKGPDVSSEEMGRDDEGAESTLLTLLGISEVEYDELEDKESGGLDMCQECGAFMAPDSGKCHNCEKARMEQEEMDDILDLESETAGEEPEAIEEVEVPIEEDSARPSIEELLVLEKERGSDIAMDLLEDLTQEAPEGLPDVVEDIEDITEIEVTDAPPEITAEVKLQKLKEAYQGGKITNDLYERNLEMFQEEIRGEQGELDSEDEYADSEISDLENLLVHEDSVTEPEYVEVLEEELDEDIKDVTGVEEVVIDAEAIGPDFDGDAYYETADEPVGEEDDDVFDEEPDVDVSRIRPTYRKPYQPTAWDYGVYSSLATSLIYLAFNFVAPGDYSISLAIIFGFILVAGLYMIFTSKDTFVKFDLFKSLPFIIGGLLTSFILLHWYMGSLTSDVGILAQPGFDRVMLSFGILLIGLGMIWVRSRVRYVFMWFFGSLNIFTFAIGEYFYFDRWAFSPVGPPGHMILAVGISMVFISTILLAYERMVVSSIESDIVRGDIDYLKRDYSKALDSYDSALAKAEERVIHDPEGVVAVNYDVPWYSKGAALILMGKLEEGIKCMDMALAINPNNEMAWVNKGNAQSRLGDLDGGLVCYENAIIANPRYVVAWNNKGNVLARQKDFVEALKCYNTAIKINPRYQDAWINKSYVLLKLGKNELAAKCVEMANLRSRDSISAQAA